MPKKQTATPAPKERAVPGRTERATPPPKPSRAPARATRRAVPAGLRCLVSGGSIVAGVAPGGVVELTDRVQCRQLVAAGAVRVLAPASDTEPLSAGDQMLVLDCAELIAEAR